MHQSDSDDRDDTYKFYFQIDTEWIKKYMDSLINKIEYKWISKDIIEEIFNKLPKYNTPLLPEGFSPIALPVNDYFSNTEDSKHTALYLGNSQYNEGIWKSKYFAYNKLDTEYVLHLQSHARHIISQPRYYEGLFEILN